MLPQPTLNKRSFLKTLNLIHTILLIGMLLFAGVVYFLDSENNSASEEGSQFLYLVPLMAIVAFFLSQFLFKKIKDQITKSAVLLAKITNLQTAYIVRFALIEAPVLFALIAFMLSGNIIHLLIAGLLIVYFFSLKPTSDKITTELNLTPEEEQVFDQQV
jgi:DMSO reductase anchor subunit